MFKPLQIQRYIYMYVSFFPPIIHNFQVTSQKVQQSGAESPITVGWMATGIFQWPNVYAHI